MKYLNFGMAALLADKCALAQTTAPVTAPSEPAKKEAVTQPAPAAAPGEPAKKDAATQPAPVKGAAAAKNVGTKDMTVNAESYRKSQERKKAQMARKAEAKGGDPKTKTAAADDPVKPSTMMTDDERAAHRKKLQSFKTLAECEAYDKQHQAEMETRAKAQHKTLRESTGTASNSYNGAATRTQINPSAPTTSSANPTPATGNNATLMHVP
jgi:hypothetical protein